MIEGNDGTIPHAVTVRDVPVDAFWSVTVQDAGGHLAPNALGRNSCNDFTAAPNGDGSITLNFERDIDRASIVAALTMTPDLRRDLVWNGDRQLELRPYEPLAAEASYRLELGTGALDASGRPLLDKPYAWSFVTSRHQTTLGFGWGLPVQLLAPSGKHGAGVQPGSRCSATTVVKMPPRT